MGGAGVVLSKRLRMIADMVTPGGVLADVGCDHAFLSVYLVSAGVCPRALAMDVRGGPLAGAGRHIREAGLEDYIEARLSDGLARYEAGEADVLVCAGMGGRLMAGILEDGLEKVKEMRELILQPQSELPLLRAYLRKAGFALTREDAVFEDGKYYFAMKAVPGTAGEGNAAAGGGVCMPCPGLCDRFGGLLLAGRHPVLFEYLLWRKGRLESLEASLQSAGTLKAGRRLEEVVRELEELEDALRFF